MASSVAALLIGLAAHCALATVPTVDAGVITIDLLNYLANYVTARAPAGWTLPAFPWYVYQTVGGAVATGTHGSSLKWGTMSNQVLEMQLVVANGSLVTLTPATHPFLMRAARVAVGKLGIITQLKMRIVREQPVTRRLRTIPASAFLSLMSEAQTSAQRGSYPDWVNETEFFWLPHRSQFMMVSFTRGDDPDPATRQAVLASYSPQNTTVFNTSRQLLQDSLVTRMEDLPLLQGVSFDTPAGLTPAAQASKLYWV
ncbi:FAD-binding PCMH-type domain-containing protein, partial [Haematococcus lacustris]